MTSETERNQKLSNSIQIYLKHQRNILQSRKKQSNQPPIYYAEKRKPSLSNLVGDWQLSSGHAIQKITSKGKPNAIYNRSSESNDQYKSDIDKAAPKWTVDGWEIDKNANPPIRSTQSGKFREDPRKPLPRGKKHKSEFITLELPEFCEGIDHFGEWKEAVTRKEQFPLLVVDKLRNPHQYGRSTVSTQSLERLFSKCGELDDVFHLEDIAIIRYKSMSSAKNAARELQTDHIEGKKLSLKYDPTGYYTSAWLRQKGITHSEYDFKTMMRRNKPKLKSQTHHDEPKDRFLIVFDTRTKQEYIVPYHYILNLQHLRKTSNLQFCINFQHRQCRRDITCNYVHAHINFWRDLDKNPEQFLADRWVEVTTFSNRLRENDFMSIFEKFAPLYVIYENGHYYIEFKTAALAYQSLELNNLIEDRVPIKFHISRGPPPPPPPPSTSRAPPPQPSRPLPPSTTFNTSAPAPYRKPSTPTTPFAGAKLKDSKPPKIKLNPGSIFPRKSSMTPTPMTPVENMQFSPVNTKKIEEMNQEQAVDNATSNIIESLSNRCYADLKKRVFIPQIQAYITEHMNEKHTVEKKNRFERMKAERDARAALAAEEMRRREKAKAERMRLENEARQRAEEESLAKKKPAAESESDSEEKVVAPRKRKKTKAKRNGYIYCSANELSRQHPHMPSESELSLTVQNIIPVPKTGCTRTEGFTRENIVDLKKRSDIRKALFRAQLEESLSQRLVDEENDLNEASSNVAEKRSNRLQSRNLRQQYGVTLAGGNMLFDDAFEFSSRKKRLRFGRSAIHEYGLFACQNIKQGEFVIQYVGEIIRAAVADRREIGYESIGIGSSYMFRLDEQYIIDATHKGNVARFINHCCDPNCQSKFIASRNETKIAIYALKDIRPGEEITFDYKFPYEEEKIPCSCGATNCRQYLN